MKLYEIASEYQSALNGLYNEENGEIDSQALAKLDESTNNFSNKGIAVASFIENLNAEENAIAEAILQMKLRASKLFRKSEYLANYLKSNMELCNVNEISCPYFSIKVKKCPASVDIINEDEIPKEYKKVKEVISLDKMKIKDDILSGKTVLGASVKYNTRLEIK